MNIKEVVSIAPKRPGTNTRLICRTKIGDRWFALTENYKLLTDEQLASPEFAGERVMEIPFDRVRRNFRFAFDIYVEQAPRKGEEVDIVEHRNYRIAEADKYNAAFNFFAKHMQIEVVGMKNPYLIGEPMYIMDFTNHRSINSVLKSRKKAEVFNRVNAMDIQQKLDLALNYMPSLYGKRHSEIMEKLVDFDSGLLMQDAYIDEFLTKYDPKNLTVSMNTYINKAIQTGIIEKRNGGMYIHGNEFVGSDEQSAMAHFNRDPETYNNFIVAKVNQMMKLPEDDLQIDIPDTARRISVMREFRANQQYKDGPEFQAKLAQAVAEAKALGIKNAHNKPYNSLLDEIEQIKQGTHPKIKSPAAPPEA